MGRLRVAGAVYIVRKQIDYSIDAMLSFLTLLC